MVDSEPNLVKPVVERDDAAGDSSPSCLNVSSLRWSETILTLLRLRMKPLEDAPTNSGRSNGKQAPMMPTEDSTINQDTRGVFSSARRGKTRSLERVLKVLTTNVRESGVQFCVSCISI